MQLASNQMGKIMTFMCICMSRRLLPTLNENVHVVHLSSLTPSCCYVGCQVCHLHGEEDWSAGVRPPRGPGGGEAQDGDDRVRLSHGQGDEESLGGRSLTSCRIYCITQMMVAKTHFKTMCYSSKLPLENCHIFLTQMEDDKQLFCL